MIDASSEYFSTIHSWMPFVSKKRMDLGMSLHNAGPDLAMLFLAMKLVTAQADEIADGTLYSMAKRFLHILESSGALSLVHLQAMILVALYEYGHAVYPAAWMTVGACARHAQVLGVSCGGLDTTPMSPPVSIATQHRLFQFFVCTSLAESSPDILGLSLHGQKPKREEECGGPFSFSIGWFAWGADGHSCSRSRLPIASSQSMTTLGYGSIISPACLGIEGIQAN